MASRSTTEKGNEGGKKEPKLRATILRKCKLRTTINVTRELISFSMQFTLHRLDLIHAIKGN
jgi:hypothetical protein